MSVRELVVLGTGSQVPTRERNHNGYLLRWDGLGILFDPGEGTQRQLELAGASVSEISRICVTHLHGDDCLGLPGVVQRLSLDGVRRPVPVHYPASGAEYVHRLRYATPFHETAELVEAPVTGDGTIADLPGGVTLVAARLDHGIEAFGYRLVEPDGRRMLPDRLAAAGVHGPEVGRLQREGLLRRGGRTVRLEDVSVPRPGMRFAFVMDTRLCPGVRVLAAGADVLVIESTFLDAEAAAAQAYGHLTARQAARAAAEAGVGTLVLTH
ncbi:MAG: ribonuclease Z, partial [Kineosporiaceae bacterium]